MRLDPKLCVALTALGIACPATAGPLAAIAPTIDSEMAAAGVPGVEVALVDHCRLVDSRSWGVRDILSGTRLEPDDRLQGASIGKPIAAFAILQLAGEQPDRYALDRPLGTDAASFGLTPPERGARVTLAQLLSHRSGLANSPFPGTRSLGFEPGSSFRYSGLGFSLAQAIVERRSGEGIDAIVRRRVFAPLGMTRSSFVDDSGVASGHMRASTLLSYAAMPGALGALLVGILLLVTRRVRSGVWRFQAGSVLAAGLGGTAAAVALFVAFMGWAAVPTILAIGAVVTLLAALGAWLVRRLVPRPGLAMAGAVLGIVLATLALAPLTLPIRTSLSGPTGNVAYSLNTDAPDLARFAIEIMRPTSPGRQAAAKLLTTPVVDAGGGMHWGLGMGERRTPGGSLVWQWAGNPGYSGLIVADPGRCRAVVILTNGERGSIVARRVVREVMGVDAPWKV